MSEAEILVTGASGTTGGAIIRQLSAAGIPARALTRNAAKGPKLPYIETAVGDLGDPDSLTPAFAGIESVYLNIVPGPDALQQLANGISAAKRAGVSLIVKLSGLHAVPDSPSAIIRMHAEGDARVRNSGIDYAILRANSFFQNIEGQLGGIKAQGKFYLPLGDARQSQIDVEDIAAVALTLFREPTLRNQDYDLTGPEALTSHEMAGILSQAAGKPIGYIPISNEAFADSLRSAGLAEAVVDSLAELFALFATGIYAEPTDDVRAVLGRAPAAYSDYAKRLFVPA
jgi:uncharacterized protein YbjT (DUF2867 family)